MPPVAASCLNERAEDASPSGATGGCLCASCVRRREYRQVWKERQMALGLCLNCKRKRVNARFCEKHRLAQNAMIQRWRDRR